MIKILLAEDHTIVREGIRELFKHETDFEIVAEAENGRQAVYLAAELCPDVIVMDVAMPNLNGIEATRQILHSKPDTRIIMLSAHADEAYVEKAMALGAAGYLIKQSASDELSTAIRQVYNGKTYFSPDISNRHFYHQRKALAEGDLTNANAAKLTPREMEVLQLVAEGKTNKESAADLHISIKTVEKHRQKVMEKLNLHDTASLTRYAIATGVIESSVQVTIIE